MFSPEWLHQIKQHVVVNAYSKDPTEEVAGYSLHYLHSTRSTLRRMAETKDFGNRFLFPSGLQCIYHQVAHHHFQLSPSQIKSDSIVIQLLVKDTHLQQHSKEAVNGFCRSLN
eukprot:1246921-Amphidinium_carterae.1